MENLVNLSFLFHHEYSGGKLSKFVSKKEAQRNQIGDNILVGDFLHHQTNCTLVMVLAF
jgi:hypothetical protein